MLKRAVWPIAIVLIGGAAPSATQAGGARGSPEDAARFIEQNIGLTAEPLTLAQLRARLRAETETEHQPPAAHGSNGRTVTLSAPGIEVDAFVPETMPVMILRIRVTADGRKLSAGLRIGVSTLDDVYDALGESADSAQGPGNEFARQYFNLEHTANAMLWFDHEKLAGVEWRFDSD